MTPIGLDYVTGSQLQKRYRTEIQFFVISKIESR